MKDDYSVLEIKRASLWNCGYGRIWVIPPTPLPWFLPTQISMPRDRVHATSDNLMTGLSPEQWQLRTKAPGCDLSLQTAPIPLFTLFPTPESVTKRCESSAGVRWGPLHLILRLGI